MNILIVDDDKSTLLMLRLLLAREGWTVEGVLDAAQGLAALRRGRFDWLLVDGQILPMDGFELAARAKELQPRLGIVMISGIYETADIMGGPIQKLFQKPVDPDRLIAYLRVGDASGSGRSARS